MDLRAQLQQSLGSGYTIERELGGGGMSQVFLAEELALGRKIVVKVLPADISTAVSAERFRREIQLAARLQHPHIVPLLSAGEAGGLPFYTMPYVQGESLRARLTRGGEMSVNDALHVLHDVAAALAYAHGEGVVHRDIKPDNVIVSGRVAVVTDFGVAKAMDVAAADSGAHTAGGGLTSMGVALGTPAYMSPEQASADPQVDHRADIYSFGCLAYELLAGVSPFAGRPPQQMLAAHVTEEPEPLARRRPSTPPALAGLVAKCLEKRPGDRPQSADELLAALDAIGTPTGGTSPTMIVHASAPKRRGLWYAAIGGMLAAGTGLWLGLRGLAPAPYAVGSTSPIATGPGIEVHPAISPDGQFVAYAAQSGAPDRAITATISGQSRTSLLNGRIYVRQVDGGRAVLLTGDLDGDHDYPFWSPDGSRLAFVAKDALYVVPALGGTPQRLFGSEGLLSPAWSSDGASIAYADLQGIWVRPADGGAARLIVSGPLLHSPAWSPDGRLVAYASGSPPVIGNTSTNAIWVIPAAPDAGDAPTPVRVSDEVHVNTSPAFTADGRALLFLSSMGGGRLDVFQQRIRANGTPIGTPARLTTGLSAMTFSLSRDGTRAAYDIVRVQSNIWMATAIPGRTVALSSAVQITRENQIVEGIALSNDGQWLAYDSNRRGSFDIYKLRLDGGEPIQLTSDPANDFIPGWSPDDREIAFHSTREGTRDIYVVSAEGGAEQVAVRGPAQELQPRWSPDGRRLAYTIVDTAGIVALVTREADGGWSQPRLLAHVGALQRTTVPQANWSPDGTLLALAVGGAIRVIPVDGGAQRTISGLAAHGYYGMLPMWGKDPNVLYVNAISTRTRASVFLAVPLHGGPPREVIAGEAGQSTYRGEFATDGRRFFFTLPRVESDVSMMQLGR
ncbi:MAG: LpqB family beta-propeller domain-containing protein [Gemmatimonadaceae bacterium]